MTTQIQIRTLGEMIGRAMARDAKAEGMPREWTGLDAQDGDQITAAGIEPNTLEWDEIERIARETFTATVA